MSQVISISSHKVEANDSVITGSDNVIFGNNNKIAGDRNKIYGNNNVIVGIDNIAKGDQNKAKGTGNSVSTPFSSIPSNPYPTTTRTILNTMPTPAINPQYQTTSPINLPASTSPVLSISPMNSYPVSTSPMNSYTVSTSPINYAMLSTSPAAYFQPVQPVPTSQAMVVVAPQPSYAAVYVNPSTQTIAPVSAAQSNPFESKKEKDKDLLQDGTMVFMINEWDTDYVREFCQLVSMTCGQQVGWQISCGRTCIVGMGDLEKIRQTIIELLPQLNKRLREWSWNAHGKNVCPDRDLYEKRLFKEYTREDVEIWLNKANQKSAA